MILASRLAPITRKENFLARAAGDNGVELEPITREEHFLQKIIDSGGSKTPVIVEFTQTGTGAGTWSGATWEDLVAAFYDGQAFLSFANDVMRITGYRTSATDGTLVELVAQGASQAGIYIWASFRNNKNVVFRTYTLSS